MMRPRRDAAQPKAWAIAVAFAHSSTGPATIRSSSAPTSTRTARQASCRSAFTPSKCGLVRRRDENRVRVAVGGARVGRQRMAGTRHRLARERQVAVVEPQLVQLRHALERARRCGHQLGPDSVTGETSDGLRHGTFGYLRFLMLDIRSLRGVAHFFRLCGGRVRRLRAA